MTDARTEILARVGRALADRPVAPPVPRDYHAIRPEGTDLLGQFARRAADCTAVVVRATAPDMVTAAGELLASRGARRVILPDGVRTGWIAATGVEVVHDHPELTHEEITSLDGVVTGCAVAIAETGTIVLDAGTDQGRRVLTLLPDYHLCVVRADQVVGTVPEAVKRLDARRPLTWISGPSATSDIGMNRVEGVHGPRTLHVLLLG